ncbi:hypothetical protein D1822_14530 [Phaeobacter inhibens]|uniref:Uncharacterized protein n=1 Tax=Phaeobacter inhibens TaxID=221822 RepID=A0A2I7IN99_9RHOB|nr:hypothetical protein [Phaeobacter inhibens]AUQ47319.1 hypothetical protein PhaeoP10_03007 [Phaeobacter inhibens]AUQ55536.1 hypothetical protein PhaeoP92_02892 [Phaeobacter inhibens]AUQ79552.1 hypothetical protein PhaeoP74_02893 [Phaeobacter inhibens]AUR00332.1 hypothetical protein PhaeoP88_02995 [Phaeobacter inhibens]AUR04944.1 hypothetical protein PhaeoP72_03001 [Phaeobacter inhibens]
MNLDWLEFLNIPCPLNWFWWSVLAVVFGTLAVLYFAVGGPYAEWVVAAVAGIFAIFAWDLSKDLGE